MEWERECDKDKEENVPEQRAGPSEGKEVKCKFSSSPGLPFSCPSFRSSLSRWLEDS